MVGEDEGELGEGIRWKKRHLSLCFGFTIFGAIKFPVNKYNGAHK